MVSGGAPGTSRPTAEEISLISFHLIRQFVSIIAIPRKMFREPFPRLVDPRQHGSRKMALFQERAERFGNFLPKRITAFFMHAGISDDGKLLRARREEEQHPVAVPGLCHSKSCEALLRQSQSFRSVTRDFPRYDYANLPG